MLTTTDMPGAGAVLLMSMSFMAAFVISRRRAARAERLLATPEGR